MYLKFAPSRVMLIHGIEQLTKFLRLEAGDIASFGFPKVRYDGVIFLRLDYPDGDGVIEITESLPKIGTEY